MTPIRQRLLTRAVRVPSSRVESTAAERASANLRVQMLSLAVACALAAAALFLGAALLGPAPAAAAPPDPADIKPPIVKKYVPFGNGRKAQTADYCKRHYHQHTYWLTKPKGIVLHHTAGAHWQSAWNTFAANTAYNNEKPGVSAHFIIDKNGRIYQCVRLSLRARHCIGMNWKTFGIEFVQETKSGKDGHWMDRQILARDRQIRAGLRLVRYLRLRYHIKKTDIFRHATANRSRLFKDYTGLKNAAGDWYAAEGKVFRSRR